MSFRDFLNEYDKELLPNLPTKNKGGDCFNLAFNYIQNNHRVILVHGLVTGQGALEGIVYNHAWCEDGSKIIDMTLPKKLQKSLDTKFYYTLGHIKITYRYTFKEALEKANEHGTYGPWEIKLQKNKY
jgi:hypothetical protein